MKKSMSEKERWLRDLVAQPNGEGCRDWPWGVNSKGYGAIKQDGVQRKAGHVILELSGRPRPFPGAFQLHSCDRPRCVAPWHLRWGTLAENEAEKVSRDRHCRGDRNGNAKLTDDDVRAIRAAVGRTYQSLAEEYGVHKTVVGRIRRGQIWSHVTA